MPGCVPGFCDELVMGQTDMASLTLLTGRRPGPALRAKPILIVIAALFLALVFGLAAAVLPTKFVLGILMPPVLLVVAAIWPEVGLAAMLVLVCGLVPPQLAPALASGGGSLKVPELMIAMMAFLAFVRQPSLRPLHGFSRWLTPIYLLMALTLSAVAVGVLFFGAGLRDALNDARNQFSWLILFSILMLIRTRPQLDRFITLVVAIGTLVALFALAQFVTGIPLLQNARVEDLNTLNRVDSDVTRSIVGPSIYFTIFAILWLLARMMAKSISGWISIPLLGILIAGVIVTFGRGVWLASLVAVLILAYNLRGWRGVGRMILLGGAMLIIAVGALSIYKPNVAAATLDRFLSTGREGVQRNTTLGWRLEEANFAVATIAKYPVFGTGMGVPYKPVSRMNGVTVTDQDVFLARYIHNSYLGLWLKFGVLGPLLAIVAMVAYIRRGLALNRSSDSVWVRTISATALSAFLVPIFTSLTQPEWLSQIGIAFLGTLFAIQLLLFRFEATSEKNSRLETES